MDTFIINNCHKCGCEIEPLVLPFKNTTDPEQCSITEMLRLCDTCAKSAYDKFMKPVPYKEFKID